ncbi:hypothetical protein K0M31_004680 [Melipona bicolor]|uniref:Uncharacterized protein n=1 Tax=Melipona bicolor TaxID=60889 RepID=A0AA40KNP7_9HYME|nr:hypothetical protein K0M31_004680 [Melipona bicolor]
MHQVTDIGRNTTEKGEEEKREVIVQVRSKYRARLELAQDRKDRGITEILARRAPRSRPKG